jgi:hypothetical protein
MGRCTSKGRSCHRSVALWSCPLFRCNGTSRPCNSPFGASDCSAMHRGASPCSRSSRLKLQSVPLSLSLSLSHPLPLSLLSQPQKLPQSLSNSQSQPNLPAMKQTKLDRTERRASLISKAQTSLQHKQEVASSPVASYQTATTSEPVCQPTSLPQTLFNSHALAPRT